MNALMKIKWKKTGTGPFKLLPKQPVIQCHLQTDRMFYHAFFFPRCLWKCTMLSYLKSFLSSQCNTSSLGQPEWPKNSAVGLSVVNETKCTVHGTNANGCNENQRGQTTSNQEFSVHEIKSPSCSVKCLPWTRKTCVQNTEETNRKTCTNSFCTLCPIGMQEVV